MEWPDRPAPPTAPPPPPPHAPPEWHPSSTKARHAARCSRSATPRDRHGEPNPPPPANPYRRSASPIPPTLHVPRCHSGRKEGRRGLCPSTPPGAEPLDLVI